MDENLEENKLELSKSSIEKPIPKYLGYIVSYYEWSAIGVAMIIIILIAGVDFILNTIKSFISIPYSKTFIYMILGLIFISSIFRWGYITRYMRAQFLSIRKLDYVMSAKAVGCNTRQILFRHILPNALTPLITFSPFFISTQILALSSLDFLGLGVIPPTPSWGELLSQGKVYFLSAWYLALFPALALFLTLALINFVGEGIRDAFDPRRY